MRRARENSLRDGKPRMQSPCDWIEMLNRRRAAIQASLVAAWREPVGRGWCRLLEESVVLDRSARLVDALLRAIRAEAATLGDLVARWIEDGRRDHQSAGHWLGVLDLLEEKVISIVREEISDPSPAIRRIMAVFALARERIDRSRETTTNASSPGSEASIRTPCRPDVGRT